jgi:hypothetical protein
LRWYPELDEYKVVEMGKTDDKGQTVKKVNIEDADYRIGVYHKNGSLIYLASPIRMVCLVSPCSYTLTVSETATYSFDDIYGMETLLTYSGGIFNLIYNDPSQNTELIELLVYKIGGSASDVLICSSNSTAFTGVLNCDVSSESGMMKAVVFRSPIRTAIATLVIDTATTIFQGTFGLFIQFMLSGIIIFLGLISPVLAIILGVVSMIFGLLLLKTITPAIFIGFSILAVLVFYFMKRSTK